MTTHDSQRGSRRRKLFAQTDAPESPQGGIANPMTFLLLAILAAFFWWSMRRRRLQDERFREQRRQETVTHAEESARDVAHIMRQAPTRASAEAAASEGLASAARVPAQPTIAPAQFDIDLGSDNGTAEVEVSDRELPGSREAAAALADRAADIEAADAARRAALEGPSEERRVGAGLAAAEEVAADMADVQRMRMVDPLVVNGQRAELVDPIDAADIIAPEVDLVIDDVRPAAEDESRAALLAGLAELDAESATDVPFGAVAGDGTDVCPAEYPIKGNLQSLIYHEPGQSSYPATIAEFCFASGEAAEAAGYRQSRARGRSKHEG